MYLLNRSLYPRVDCRRVQDRLKTLLYYLLLIAGLLWLGITQRLLSSLIFLVILVVHRPRIGWRRGIASVVLWGIFYASSVAPFDITFINYPGPPRFVRLLVGLPTAEGYLLLEQHQAVWAGCVMHRNQPKWVLVW